jgi:hypothetical protein
VTFGKRAALIVTVLSALGVTNGVWQWVTAPVLLWLRDLALNVITLGINRVKDGIYADVARGYHEHAMMLALVFLTFVSVTLPALLLIPLMKTSLRRMQRLLLDTSHMQVSKTSATSEAPLQWMFGNPIHQPKQYYRRMKLFFLVAIAYTVLLAALFAAEVLRVSYATNAVTYYRQLHAIITPYATSADLVLYDSRFAQIHHASDYRQLVDELKNIASQHGAVLPDFNVW